MLNGTSEAPPSSEKVDGNEEQSAPAGILVTQHGETVNPANGTLDRPNRPISRAPEPVMIPVSESRPSQSADNPKEKDPKFFRSATLSTPAEDPSDKEQQKTDKLDKSDNSDESDDKKEKTSSTRYPAVGSEGTVPMDIGTPSYAAQP